MTCRGYDPKAIKLPSLVKMASARILDAHERGRFIRAHADAIRENLKNSGRSTNKKAKG